jgi:hypothetical protein
MMKQQKSILGGLEKLGVIHAAMHGLDGKRDREHHVERSASGADRHILSATAMQRLDDTRCSALQAADGVVRDRTSAGALFATNVAKKKNPNRMS